MSLRTYRYLLAATLVVAAGIAQARTLEPTELAVLVEDARSALVAAARQPDSADALDAALQRANREHDPVRREAMLEAWLRDWVGPSPVEEPDPEQLRALLDFQPVARIPHHDHPGRTQAAFHVAAHARNRLREQQLRLEAGKLLGDPEAIHAALLQPERSLRFEAALAAIERSPEASRRTIAAELVASFPKRQASGAAVLALVDRAVIEPSALIDLVDGAEVTVARRALRKAHVLAPDQRTRLLETALDRPELGGLAVGLAAASGDPALQERIWHLLGDPERGADAALALSRTGPGMTDAIDRDFDGATPNARLRMLLALRLQDSDASRGLLERLVTDRRLRPTELRATEAWR